MTKFWLDFDWKICTPMNLKVGTWPKFKAPTNINFTTKKYAGACKWLPPFCLFTFYKKREQPLIFYQLKIILYSKLVLLLRNLCRCSINWIKKFGIGIIFRSYLNRYFLASLSRSYYQSSYRFMWAFSGLHVIHN